MARPKEFDPDQAVGRAMDVFWERGFEDTSAQDLVDALGIGRGSLYNAFGSKHELFERALDRYCDDQTEGLALRLAEAPRVRPAIRAVLRDMADTDLAGGHRRGCLMVNSAADLGGRDPLVAEKVRRAYERIENALAAAIRRGRASGELGPGPAPEALARFMLTTINGLRVVGKVSNDRRRLDDTIEIATRALG